MKQLHLFAVALITLAGFSGLNAQDFTWIRGSSSNGSITGVYGTQGVPSGANDPGTRHGAATWVDTAGNLWLFGGEGFSSVNSYSMLNDLWRYNPATNEWTWIRGSNGPNAPGNYGTQTVPSPANEPRAREFAATWVDNQGNFWLFGGDAMVNQATYTLGRLSDLWRYNPTTNEWTWMKGSATLDLNGTYGVLNTASSSNLPGARYAPATWTDASGDLWMFGGRGFAASGVNSHLNDLWKYTVATNQWTWMGGTQLGSQNGVYGTMGQAAATNIPGGIEFPCSWKDASGRFYLFAGRGFGASGSPGWLQDVWRYDTGTGQWTWLKGSGLINQLGAYGTLGVSSPTTLPGGRYSAAHWQDLSGNFWVFGGYGWPSSPTVAQLNDLFKYDPVSNEFTWVKGSNTANAAGVYGTQGVSSSSNIPGARYFNNYWKTLNNTFWLFGGLGRDINGTNSDNLNDLWTLKIPCNPDNIVASPSSSVCTGNQVSLSLSASPTLGVISWYASSGATIPIATGSVFVTPTLTSGATSTVYNYYVSVNSCSATPKSVISISVSPSPTVAVSGNTLVCTSHSTHLVASGALSYSWNTGATGATLSTLPAGNTAFTVTGINGPGCTGSATVGIGTIPSPTVNITVLATPSNCVKPNQSFTLSAAGAGSYTWSGNQNGSQAVYTQTLMVRSYSVTGTGTNGCTASSVVTLTLCPVGIAENSDGTTQLIVYPNPSSNTFVVDLGIEPVSAGQYRLSISDFTGRELYNSELNESKTQVLHSLTKGAYLVKVKSEHNQATKSCILLVE